jgi:hypothetical protein
MTVTPLLRGAGALVGAAAALSAAPALAQPAADSPLGFGVRALGHRSYFVFDASAGQRVQGRLLLKNASARERLIFLRPVDVTTAVSGGLDYADQRSRPRRAGGWIRLSRKTVRLRGGEAVEVPFSARLPRGARSGDHFAGILAFARPRARRAARSRFVLKLRSRLAIAVQFRVPGPRKPALQHRSTSIEVLPSGAALALGLANGGNTLVRRTSGRVTVSRDGRRLFSQDVDVDAFVPATQIELLVPWTGRPAEGDYDVRGILRPRGAAPITIATRVAFGDDLAREFRDETGRPAGEADGPPLLLIAILLAMAAGLVALATAYLRLRRRI